MPLPITMYLKCPKCGYSTIKTISDTDIEIIFVKCPKCGASMEREPIDKAFSFGSILSKIFKK